MTPPKFLLQGLGLWARLQPHSISSGSTDNKGSARCNRRSLRTPGDVHALRLDQDADAGFDNLLNRLQHRRGAAKRRNAMACGPGSPMFCAFRWKERGRAAGDEQRIARGRGGRTLGHVITVRPRDSVTRAAACPDPWLGPNLEHVVEAVRSRRHEAECLRASQGGSSRLLFDAGGETHDALPREEICRAPRCSVIATQRRAAIAADRSHGGFARQRFESTHKCATVAAMETSASG
ncbi:MAG: hypothetical protein LBV61_00105 [Burkholderiaceae bacterium]|nr:hypothetical protein [Burkholderiaceae bacterium]